MVTMPRCGLLRCARNDAGEAHRLGMTSPRIRKIRERGKTDLPDGQISSRFDYPVSSPICKKNFRFAITPNQIYIPGRLAPLEGRIAIVTDAVRDAVDASGAADESAGLRTAKSCGPDTPTLVSSRWRQLRSMTVARKPGHRGERDISR